jgi:nucleoid-associated protein YgaU
MDLKSFWESQRSTIISAAIAIVVIAGLFILFNALPASEPAEKSEDEKQEQTQEEKNAENDKDNSEKDEGKVELPAKYMVKRGDSLWGISKAHYGSGYKWAAIASVNRISNPDQIFAGSKLTIPKTSDYKVKSGDTLWDISERVYGSGFEWTKIHDANPGKVGTLPNGNSLIMAGQVLVIP